MRQQRSIVVAVLGITCLLVAALVGVLTLGGPAPLEPDSGARLIGRSHGTAPEAPLPEPLAESLPEAASAPAPLHLRATPPAGPSIIIGRVLDEETGAPVTTFSIKAVPHDGRPPLPRLDEEPGKPQPVRAVAGIFRLERGKGRWDVVVQAATYLPGELLDVEIPRPDAHPLELRLSHGPSITGLVYDDSNMGVPDVPVFLHVERLALGGPPPKNAIARTDAAGRFRFSPLPAGLYGLSALEPNSADKVSDIALDHGTAEVSLYVAPRHQVMAAVRDAWGRPVRDAHVELRGSDSMDTEATNDAGQAQLRFLKPGHYDVKVTREGYVELADALDLDSRSGDLVRWYTLQEAP
ncbi:MAG TPA: carboxypeptidase-like regulatory domain-containing protein [Planctomycetota bacterium]|nr:carboxypeptidase-like regulatory domain-containing protein [Planctomycetota bacterium]